MHPKQFVIGTVVGGSVVFATGVLIFLSAPLKDFYTYAMNAGSATGVPRETPLMWAVFAGALSYGALMTLAIGSRPARIGIVAGAGIGALTGFLLWFTANFMFYGISNVGNLVSTFISPVIELVPGAVAGGVIAVVLNRIRGVESLKAADGAHPG